MAGIELPVVSYVPICKLSPFCQLTLTTIDNPLANVSAGRTVNMFYTQNSKLINWQNLIGDAKLKEAITDAQKPCSF